jgi:hypothetical protein
MMRYTYVRVCRLRVPEHSEHPEDIPALTHRPTIGITGVCKTDGIRLEERQREAYKLIATIQRSRLPIPCKVGFDN